jgi:5-methylcytosine-specific restriction endonuclease McrA
MKYVLVIDTNHRPLMPCKSARARLLLRQGKAAVFRRFPFTIILKHAILTSSNELLRLKIDPGSQTTGMAIINDKSGDVVLAAEINHRGSQVKDALDQRRMIRRSRRNRKTRYRPARFYNRHRSQGYLSPSLKSRLINICTWVNRFQKVCPITNLSQELVRFDIQALQNPEIAGITYQQGTLMGYELREYLREKWGRRCAYCGAEGVPLQIEHIIPKTRGGTDRVNNLTLACQDCNQQKGKQTAEEFGYPDIQTQANTSFKSATIVNTMRWALWQQLQGIGLPVEVGTGGCTKFNRSLRGLPKTHWLDAACVGTSTPTSLCVEGVVPLLIRATGRGTRQMCRMDRFGFPRTGPKTIRTVQGFRTGDITRAVVSSGMKKGVYVGRVAVRANRNFNIQTKAGTIQGLHARYFTILHRSDGCYQKGKAVFSPVTSMQGYSPQDVEDR